MTVLPCLGHLLSTSAILTKKKKIHSPILTGLLTGLWCQNDRRFISWGQGGSQSFPQGKGISVPLLCIGSWQSLWVCSDVHQLKSLVQNQGDPCRASRHGGIGYGSSLCCHPYPPPGLPFPHPDPVPPSPHLPATQQFTYCSWQVQLQCQWRPPATSPPIALAFAQSQRTLQHVYNQVRTHSTSGNQLRIRF